MGWWKLLSLRKSIEKSIILLVLTRYVLRWCLIYFDLTRGGPSLRRICEFREGNMPEGNALRDLEIGRMMESETVLLRREKSYKWFDCDFVKSNEACIFERNERLNWETRILNVYLICCRNFSRIKMFRFIKCKDCIKKENVIENNHNKNFFI